MANSQLGYRVRWAGHYERHSEFHDEYVPDVRNAESSEALVVSTHGDGPPVAQSYGTAAGVGTTLLFAD